MNQIKLNERNIEDWKSWLKGRGLNEYKYQDDDFELKVKHLKTNSDFKYLPFFVAGFVCLWIILSIYSDTRLISEAGHPGLSFLILLGIIGLFVFIIWLTDGFIDSMIYKNKFYYSYKRFEKEDWSTNKEEAK